MISMGRIGRRGRRALRIQDKGAVLYDFLIERETGYEDCCR